MPDLAKGYKNLYECRMTLQDQLFGQTAAMFKYCYNSGIAVQDNLFREFDLIFQKWILKRKYYIPDSGPELSLEKDSVENNPPENFINLNKEKNGDIDLGKVARIHNTLAGKVSPARPASIYLIESEMLPVPWWKTVFFLRFLGPVRIVRYMMGVSIIMLLAFLIVSLYEEVNLKNLALSLYDLHGKAQLLNLIFLLASAGIGASFAALFELRSFISSRTYDTVYATDYWIRFILGLISGLILAELVPVREILDTDSYITDLARPVFAMLGGFSVQAVYRILQRIVQTLETLVQGRESSQDDVARKSEIKEEAKKHVMKAKTDFLSNLSDIQKVINKGEEPDKIKEVVNNVFDKISSFSE